MQGPLLTATADKLWCRTLRSLIARGTKIILLGAAFFKYTAAEFAAVDSFLEQFPPVAISTRDSRSFEILKSWDKGIPLYDGLDSAFFVPKAYTPFRFSIEPYLVLTFDRFPEPDIHLGAGRDPTASVAFEYRGKTWNLYVPKLQDYFSHKGKATAYLGHLLDFRTLPAEIDGLLVMRPGHRFNPHMTFKIYRHANSVASDEPWTYFNIYANSELVLADRVHACVLTLAFGHDAMLFTPSPRQALFARVGVTEIRQRPVGIDMARLEEERMKQLAWLKDRLS
jgi:polysaccharide pyruvyl transferase WcaK-like protein